MPLRILTRLTLADLRSHRLAAVLNALVIGVAAATLTLSVAVGRLGDDPWQRTFEATNGAHVLVSSPNRLAVVRLADEPGVTAASPAIPSTFSSFEHDRRTIGVVAFGVPSAGSPVAQPYVTNGRWVRASGEIVLERSFARYYDLGAGDRLAVATSSGRVDLAVVGVAVTASQERYPEGQPGAAFVAPETLVRIQPDRTRGTTRSASGSTTPTGARRSRAGSTAVVGMSSPRTGRSSARRRPRTRARSGSS